MPAEPFHADIALARRLERLAGEEMRRFAEAAARIDPSTGAEWRRIGGGVAAFVGLGSPVNMAFGMGMDGPVDGSDVLELERFYASRGAGATVSVCPLAHPTLFRALAERGWALDGFEHVLALPLEGRDDSGQDADVEIRPVSTPEDRELWVTVAATGFSAPLPPLDAQLRLAAIAVERPGSRLFTGWVDGKVAGTAELYIEDGVAWLSADTTLPQFQRRGVQQALQRHRLRLGVEHGCELAVTECQPGSQSQRNMERLGFRVVYTRAELVRPQSSDIAEGTDS